MEGLPLDELNSSEELLEDSSSSSSNLDHRFQEALCREKKDKTNNKDGLNYVVLKKSYLIQQGEDSRKTHSPCKKVSKEDSGWTVVASKKVSPGKRNLCNKSIMYQNKNVNWYHVNYYPNMFRNTYFNGKSTHPQSYLPNTSHPKYKSTNNYHNQQC